MKIPSISMFLLSVLPLTCLAQITEQEFSELHLALNPVDETWKTIPWRTSLIQAQNEAAVQEKPIFVWAMDGHPLGCT